MLNSIVLPLCRPTKAGRKGILGSSYKNLVSTSDLVLQERKKQSKSETFKKSPNFRIITRAGHISYIIWHGDTLDQVMENEWKYIIEDLPKLFPADYVSGSKKARDWLLNHFSQLSTELPQANENNVIWSDISSSDSENEAEGGKDGEGTANEEREIITTSGGEEKKKVESPKKFTPKNLLKELKEKAGRGARSDTAATVEDMIGKGGDKVEEGGHSTKGLTPMKPPKAPKKIPPPMHLDSRLSDIQEEVTKSGRLIRWFGAMVATNAFIQLLLESTKDQQVYLIVLVNLFVMYIIVGVGLDTKKSKGDHDDVSPSLSLKGSIAAPAMSGNSAVISALQSGNPIGTNQTVLKLPVGGKTLPVCNYGDNVANSFSKIPASTFDVRVGPDYPKNKKKEPRYVHALFVFPVHFSFVLFVGVQHFISTLLLIAPAHCVSFFT
jgi:hypothetical protein